MNKTKQFTDRDIDMMRQQQFQNYIDRINNTKTFPDLYRIVNERYEYMLPEVANDMVQHLKDGAVDFVLRLKEIHKKKNGL